MSRAEAENALKELSELEKEQLKKKRELEKLKQKIRNAAKQVRDERDYEDKVPIEQVTATSAKGLTAEEKAIFEVHHGKSSESDDDESDEKKKGLENKTKQESDGSLEGTVAAAALRSRFDPNAEAMQMQAHNYQQVIELSQQPMTQLYDQMKNIYDTSVAEGYVSGPVAAQTFELESAIERKLHDIDAGNYQFTNQETAKAASVSLSMKEKLSAMYVAGKDHGSGNDLYQ